MKRKLPLLVGLFLLGLPNFSPAQTYVPHYNLSLGENQVSYGAEMTGISPQINSFMRYGGDTPNLYTGTVSTTIPVYTYQDEDFTIPISLNYASNGYTPNIQSNYVGLGWYLQTGGMITRKVRGIPDEGEAFIPTSKGKSDLLYGYRHPDIPTPAKLPETGLNPDNVHIWDNRTYYYTYDDHRTKKETQPDLYTFNFMGHHGSFMTAGVFDTGNRPAGEYKVMLYPFDSTDKSITINTGDGYRYDFIVRSVAQRSFAEHPTNAQGWTPSSAIGEEVLAPDTWYLQKITAPNGRSVRFDYDGDFPPGNAELIESRRPVQRRESYGEALLPGEKTYDRMVNYREEAVQLKSIQIDGGVSIRFTYGTRNPEKYAVMGSSGRLEINLATPPKLDNIVVSKTTPSGGSVVLKTCALAYNYGTNNPVLMLSRVNVSGVGTYRMEYYNANQPFPMQGTNAVDHWGYYKVHDVLNMYGELPATPGGGGLGSSPFDFSYLLRHPGVRRSSAEDAKLGMLTKMTYPTGGYTTFQYESHGYGLYLNRGENGQPSLRAPVNGEIQTVGGLRIKKITNYTQLGTADSKTYDYNSSGILLHVPFYTYQISWMPTAWVEPVIRSTDWIVDNKAATLNYATEGTHIEYRKVTEKHSDGSSVVYEFATYPEAPGRFDNSKPMLPHPWYYIGKWVAKLWFPDPMLAERVYNFQRKPDYEPSLRGKLLVVTEQDKRGWPVHQKNYSYTSYAVPNAYIEMVDLAGIQFYIRRSYMGSIRLNDVRTEDCAPGAQSVVKTIHYTYNDRGQLKKSSWFEGNRRTYRTKEVTYVSDIPANERTLDQVHMVSANILNLPIEIKEYIDGYNAISDRVITRAEKYEYETVFVGEGKIIIRPYKHWVAKLDHRAQLYGEEGLDYYCKTTYRYDNLGRLLQQTDHTGLETSYLWGDDGLYPVAKVAGAAGMTSVSSVAEAESLRDTPGFQVTTYEYDPHVGVTKVVDPLGIVQRYTYDADGRLTGESRGDIDHTYSYSVSSDNDL